ncbi:MAG: NAD+ synthase [Myxococcota bacterium]|jgi:NAD+ synthase/NAD+ synthase (glutamine-hydrolysing)|nr:NAD+ synthase [Myxococcota bacterium]
MKIAIAQLNPTVGHLDANAEAIRQALDAADAAGADLLITPELALCGYPPKDLLENPNFIRDALAMQKQLSEETYTTPFILGGIASEQSDPLTPGQQIYNAALVFDAGEIKACHRKILLPNYDVFDEARYFSAGQGPTLYTVKGENIGITICEDIWNDKTYWSSGNYDTNPVQESIDAGATCIVNLSASPFGRGKHKTRTKMLEELSGQHQVPLIYVNQVGGNDGLIFDGRSMVVATSGEKSFMAPAFQSGVFIADTVSTTSVDDPSATWNEDRDVREALILGVRDYVRKCGFKKVVLGLSGGIDSTITAAIAAAAVGPENVIGIGMPSEYSSQGSIDDAKELATRLGIRFDMIPIQEIFGAFNQSLSSAFSDFPPDVTEENLQARIRGSLLMAYSNKFGALLLTTGNKSECAVGYCTLYGDMCGGLAVISDLYKTEVYDLCRDWNNAANPPIPETCIEKPPSAELRPEQKDEDSLPPYDVLDGILRAYIDELDESENIIRKGYSAELVHQVINMVTMTEYKRRQMPPGLKVSPKAFGEGRRLPIAQAYKPKK